MGYAYPGGERDSVLCGVFAGDVCARAVEAEDEAVEEEDWGSEYTLLVR